MSLTCARGFHWLGLVTLACVLGSCRSTPSPLQPGGNACAVGPIAEPAGTLCLQDKPGCPDTRPRGARTLVGVATCKYETGTEPCVPRTLVCPLTDPRGNTPLRFAIGAACGPIVEMLLQSSGDGGAGIEWRAQDFAMTGGRCVARGQQHVGLASVSGSCCSTTVDVDVPGSSAIFRFTAQTDWLAP